MPANQLSHPDRLATTLATLQAARAARPDREPTAAAAGAADCRIEGKLLQFHALRAAKLQPSAAAHLEPFRQELFPELWAGTVQDGVARGFQVRLEEVCSLAGILPPITPTTESECGPAPAVARDDKLVTFTGKDLRRKSGLLFVDREHDINSENCLWFEGRRDHGTLDGFQGADDERARLFSAQFLKPQRFVQGKHYTELELNGRLGRGNIGWPCRILLVGLSDEPSLRMTIDLGATVPGWRLRSRFLGFPADLLHHHCMPVREHVQSDRGGFMADTLVRSCATLLIDGQPMPVPDAASPRGIRHNFSLGNRPH
jgi:hypothetical protein